MGINDFNDLSESDHAGSCRSEHERVENMQPSWHRADTEAFAGCSDPSILHADLLATRNNMLALRRQRPDLKPIIGCMVDLIEHRLGAPDDPDHAAQYKRNARDIERQLGRAA